MLVGDAQKYIGAKEKQMRIKEMLLISKNPPYAILFL